MKFTINLLDKDQLEKCLALLASIQSEAQMELLNNLEKYQKEIKEEYGGNIKNFCLEKAVNNRGNYALKVFKFLMIENDRKDCKNED